jgi:hypothetical protein
MYSLFSFFGLITFLFLNGDLLRFFLSCYLDAEKIGRKKRRKFLSFERFGVMFCSEQMGVFGSIESIRCAWVLNSG